MKIFLFIFCLFLFHKSIFGKIGSKEKAFLSLNRFVQRLEEYAPLKTATEWDNVGLLVEPSGNFLIKRILVTNDLTGPVLDEAILRKVDLIISYHPPIVKTQPPNERLHPITRLTQSNWREVALIKCIENRIAVYSPHTTWDSIDGGINDWILSVFSKLIFPIILIFKSVSHKNQAVELSAENSTF